MAILKKGKIFLDIEKCRDTGAFMNEIMEARQLCDTPVLTILDRRSITNDKMKRQVYLNADRIDEFGEKIFDQCLWLDLIKFYTGLSGRYLTISLLMKDSIYREELAMMNPVESIETSDELQFVFWIDEKLLAHLSENSLDNQGKIKWFNASITQHINQKEAKFHSIHFGSEYYINDISDEEVEQLMEILKESYFFLRIEDALCSKR